MNADEIETLSAWEWSTLVAAWRYYENRCSIVAAKDGADASLELTLPPFVATKFKNGRNGIPCFRCETTRRLYPVSEYVRHPQMEVHMDELMVEEVGRDGCKSWWGEVTRISRQKRKERSK